MSINPLVTSFQQVWFSLPAEYSPDPVSGQGGKPSEKVRPYQSLNETKSQWFDLDLSQHTLRPSMEGNSTNEVILNYYSSVIFD